MEPVENIGNVFPVLEIGSCQGSAIRSHCWIASGHRFSAVGYDAGHVIASVCKMTEGTIVDRFVIYISQGNSMNLLLSQSRP